MKDFDLRGEDSPLRRLDSTYEESLAVKNKMMQTCEGETRLATHLDHSDLREEIRREGDQTRAAKKDSQ